ncbi:MAG: hypothetical protein R2845_04300 [Thermomicrobiales bacterium]
MLSSLLVRGSIEQHETSNRPTNSAQLALAAMITARGLRSPVIAPPSNGPSALPSENALPATPNAARGWLPAASITPTFEFTLVLSPPMKKPVMARKAASGTNAQARSPGPRTRAHCQRSRNEQAALTDPVGKPAHHDCADGGDPTPPSASTNPTVVATLSR